MGNSISGLGSGLDIASIVNSLMAVEALPQQMLQSKQMADQSMISALQTLNAKAASLNSLATDDSVAGAMNLFTATSSSSAVTATATTGASAGSIDVVFSQLASTKVGVSAAMSTWPLDASGNVEHLTLVDATGKQTEVVPASASLDDVVAAVNAASGGATAMKVPAGNGTYRLQFTSSQSGAAGDFQAYIGTAADVTANNGSAIDLFSQSGAAVVTPAQDAQATLYAGTSAAQTITSSTNTFTNILPGVTATATAASSTAVTITVASDTTGISNKASALVSAVNGLLSYISTNSAVTPTSGSNGTTGATGGIFTGDSTISDVSSQITDAVVTPINGHSPSEYGISINQDGSFTFDSTKLSSALAADPAGTQAALQTIASRVAAAAKNVSDPVTGSVTALIAGRQSEVTDLTNSIADWDTRLADRRATLQAQFNAMDVAMGTLKSQQSWLTSQIASLPSAPSTSKSGS